MSEPPLRPFVLSQHVYRWNDVEVQQYKDAAGAPFRAVTRQTLFRRDDLRGELRYFEIAPGGHSTLERHAHAHAVMILRGDGEALVGETVFGVKTFDLVTVAPRTWHQFRALENAPLGFLCMVDAERDRPQLPDERELADLRSVAHVAAFLAAIDR